ncbi:hypothetical protein RFI_36064, partial [Reticulomyxa filosa]
KMKKSILKICKFKSRYRHNFLCSSSPTLAITSIQAKELKSATSVIKLIGLNNRHQLSSDVIAHTFSGNLRTLYVHFAVNVNAQHLQQLCETFNKKQLESDSDEKSENKFKKSKRQPKCQIYLRNYVDEIKKRKQQEIFNPELNEIVLLKNVQIRESEKEIKETLEEYVYSVEQVKRFNRMPMILQDKDIQIGYAMTQVILFDKNKSRPKHHFKQCRNCFKLNHIAKECPSKRKTCKYCGLKNHEASKSCIDVYYARKIIQVILYSEKLFEMQEKNLESN